MNQSLILDTQTESAKNTARMLYFVHGLTFVFSLGMLSIIPVIINYMKRPEAAGTLVHSHHTWMIRSFWWYVVWFAIGAVMFATFVGIPLAWLIWCVIWVWKAYRLVRGFIDLNNNQAMPV